MPTSTDSEKQTAAIAIPLKAASLRNGYVPLKDYLWFFPKSAISSDRTDEDAPTTCALELEGLGTVETEIDSEKGFFRWRGWKKFFRLHSVNEGDAIVFSRVERGRFAVSVKHAVLEGMSLSLAQANNLPTPKLRNTSSTRGNDLSGDEWLRFSISVWSDIRKTADEVALNHPAIFPAMLCQRLIMMFLRRRGRDRVLDPFMGSGSTLLAARALGKVGIGLDISPEYIQLARSRLDAPTLFKPSAAPYFIHQGDARRVLDFIKPHSVDLCITSPPYWNILNQARTADAKEIRHYGNLPDDLGTIADYGSFLDQLALAFGQVYEALRPSAYCVVVVMDLRKKDRFYPFHSDLAERLKGVGFIFDDLIVWDRGSEYNNLRPLGYPSVFRINKIHEFILIFKKPARDSHDR